MQTAIQPLRPGLEAAAASSAKAAYDAAHAASLQAHNAFSDLRASMVARHRADALLKDDAVFGALEADQAKAKASANREVETRAAYMAILGGAMSGSGAGLGPDPV